MKFDILKLSSHFIAQKKVSYMKEPNYGLAIIDRGQL